MLIFKFDNINERMSDPHAVGCQASKNYSGKHDFCQSISIQLRSLSSLMKIPGDLLKNN